MSGEIISKELLSEVLGVEVTDFYLGENVIHIDTTKGYIRYNIHELAHECKEWAYNEGYQMIENSDVIYVYHLIPYGTESDYNCPLYSVSSVNKVYDLNRVFKATQWMKDNK